MLKRDLFKAAVMAAGLGAPGLATAGGSRGGRAGCWVEAPDGARLYVRDHGAGPTVVFMAPWALNSAWWDYQIAAFASDGLRCIAIDRRGHGRSDDPATGYDFDTLADDLEAVLAARGLNGVTLVGQSMGCGEVVRYLSRHGAARIARVVLVGTITPFVLQTADNPDGTDPRMLAAVRKALAADRAQPVADAAPAFFNAPANPVSPEIMAWWTRMMVDRCSLSAILALHKLFTETDFRPELRKITVPVRLIHGDKDVSTPLQTTARKTVALIPGARLTVYENAGHGLPYTHRERLNAEIAAFVGR